MPQTHTKQLEGTKPEGPNERWRLFGLAVLMALAGVGLDVVGGAPRLPNQELRLDQLAAVLSGSTLPWQPLARVLVDLAWLMWAWIVGSLGLEAGVVAGGMIVPAAQRLLAAGGEVGAEHVGLTASLDHERRGRTRVVHGHVALSRDRRHGRHPALFLLVSEVVPGRDRSLLGVAVGLLGRSGQNI